MRIESYSPKQLKEFHDRNRPDAEHPIGADDLAEFLRYPSRWRQTATGLIVPRQDLSALPEWMRGVYSEIGFKKGTEIVVPALPRISDKQEKSLSQLRMFLLYVPPAIGEGAYPESFKPLQWNQFLDASQIERRPLPGRWVAVETIVRPDWNDPNGYGDDPVTSAFNLQSRFGISWDDHHAPKGTLARLAKKYGLPKKGTRFGTAEEWNFIANVMLWLREHREMTFLPDLGSANSWEWCENLCESVNRLVAGYRDNGGLSAVSRRWRGHPHGPVGFRVLVQF